MAKFQLLFNKVGTNKIVIGFAAILMVAVIATTNAASAAPDYFDVAKPSSTSQCFGSTTTYHWVWKWEHRNWHGHNYFWGGHWERVPVETPNWEQLGFSSQDQCVRYTSTAAPKTRSDCTQRNWYTLGFNNAHQCIRYARTHGNNGYGGNE